MAELGADLRIGPYQVVGRLGGGAMGTVHLARSPGGRLVAVKVARPELAEDPRFRERFRREVVMARAVGGFWTAAVVDADPDGPRPWLATEYIPGPDLHEAVRSAGALPPDAVRALAAGLAEALAAIHAAGLVHRDLKPSNVLLAADGPRVIDFGIAKALEGSGLTHTGMVVGTPGYLSPEQIEGRDVGPASDVFAFAAVVAFAASGRNPFGEGDTAALLYRAVHTRPDLRDVPHDLRELVARCLEYKARARPSAPELVAALGGRASGEWLPPAVRSMVDRMATEVVAVRPPTKVLPGDHLSARARWWLERGEHVQPPTVPPPAIPLTAGSPPAGPPPAGSSPADPSHAGPLAAGAPTAGPPPAGSSAAGPLTSDDRPGLAARLRRAIAPPVVAPPTVAPAVPSDSGAPAGSAAPVAPAGPAASPAPAASSAGAAPVKAGLAARLREALRVETAPEPGPRSAPAAVAERPASGRAWWARALGWVEQAPPPPPEPQREQLADRVSKLVEQARDAMAEANQPNRKPGRSTKLGKAERRAVSGKEQKAGKERKAPAPKGAGNQAVFSTARAPRALSATVGLGGAVLLAAAAAEASRTGQPGIGLLVLLIAGLLALVALRRAGQALGRQRRAEITAAGISWRRGATASTLAWPRVARVRIVEDKNQPWLVVWPRDPSALPGKPDHHGGYRVYPIAHEKSAKARAREIGELRAALSWYGRSAYDGS